MNATAAQQLMTLRKSNTKKGVRQYRDALVEYYGFMDIEDHIEWFRNNPTAVGCRVDYIAHMMTRPK